ncbi:hypothetical protein EVAR_94716_1 [Eumeta japonica]|uniref:Uncharacterized protein n=1 Tax=Eumeta variegata TaxID=151549 RepID=A0A4C1UX02_EUMVA|nr:hypothetical protein EVAR_94716_1 [Eumeta japonica]
MFNSETPIRFIITKECAAIIVGRSPSVVFLILNRGEKKNGPMRGRNPGNLAVRSIPTNYPSIFNNQISLCVTLFLLYRGSLNLFTRIKNIFHLSPTCVRRVRVSHSNARVRIVPVRNLEVVVCAVAHLPALAHPIGRIIPITATLISFIGTIFCCTPRVVLRTEKKSCKSKPVRIRVGGISRDIIPLIRLGRCDPATRFWHESLSEGSPRPRDLMADGVVQWRRGHASPGLPSNQPIVSLREARGACAIVNTIGIK